MAAPQQSNIPSAATSPAAQPLLLVYERSITRHLRVLDAKIARLELQLNEELEKISSPSLLLEEISKPYTAAASSSAGWSLRQEIHETRAKRDRIYQDLQQRQQIPAGDDDGNGGADGAPPPAAGASQQQAPGNKQAAPII